MSNAFDIRCRIKFGTGNVQIGTGFDKESGARIIAFKPLENAFHPVPNDLTKSLEQNGYSCLLHFSTVESIDAVINVLQFIRDDLEKAKLEELENA